MEEPMATALWSLYETQKAGGMAPAMRHTLFKLDKAGYRDDKWFNAMGELAMLEGKQHQAIRCFAQAAKIREKPEYRLNLGNAYFFAGDYSGAKRVWKTYLESNPDDTHAQLNLVNCHLRLGELDSVESLCHEGLSRGMDPAPLWNALGQTCFLRGRFDEALARFDQAYASAPDSVDALFNRANAYYRLGQLQAALADYAQCVRKDENYEAAWQNRAIACLEAGEEEEALTSVEMALKLSPSAIENLYLMARVRLERHESNLARELLRKVLRQQPEHVPGLLAMARVCLLDEEREAACGWAMRVLMRSPPAAMEEAICALGLLVQMGEYESALQAILRSQFPGKGGKIGFFKSVCLWKTGKLREAMTELEVLLAEDSQNSAEGLTLLGMMLEETGAHDLAAGRFRKALERQPDNLLASQQLALLWSQKESWEKAIAVLEEALCHAPDHPDLLYNLACCQVRSGNLDDAWASLQKAVDHGFDDVTRLLDDEDLKSLRELREFAPLLR